MRHGEWTTDKVAFMKTCSECDESVDFSHDYKYCPNCGAKMDSDKPIKTLTVKELYDFLHEHDINDNDIDILYRDPETEDVHWVGYHCDKAEALKIHGNHEVDGVDIYEKDVASQAQQENTFVPMKVSVAVPTADGAVALVKVNNIEELNNLKKNGVTNEMIKNAEKLRRDNDTEIVGNVLQQIEVGRVYRHFKGKLYLVLDLAQHSETEEQYVVYKALYGDCKTYIRPYLMFASGVDHEKYPDVEQTFRFELVED